MRTKHFIVGTNEDNKRDDRIAGQRHSGDLEDSIRKLVKQRSGRGGLYCTKCESRNLEYSGLGKYICLQCKNVVLNNYGKVRECVDLYGSMSVIEVMDKTGLTKEDIVELEKEGSIRLNTQGKIKLM